MEIFTHFKKIKLTDYLGSWDLQRGQELILTIKEVKVEEVKGQKGKLTKCNVCYWVEPNVKKMIINLTNGKIIQGFAKDNSPYIEDWKGITVKLYIDYKIKMKGETVDGLRISPVAVKKELPLATEDLLKKSIEAISTGVKEKVATINWYKKNTRITDEQLKRLEDL